MVEISLCANACFQEVKGVGREQRAVWPRRRGRNLEMIMSKEFINPKTLIAPGPVVYSRIAKVNRGTIIYISGQVPSDASTDQA